MKSPERILLTLTKVMVTAIALTVFVVIALVWVLWFEPQSSSSATTPNLAVNVAPVKPVIDYWQAPVISSIPEEDKEMVLYGKDLIANTAHFLGPNGTVAQMSNGMNCQNCHLDAGTKAFGNNYSGVSSNYPKVRARSGKEESIEKRINDCFERSLNGDKLPEESKEMQAMVAYMKWLGTGVEKGESPTGVGLPQLPYLDRPADMVKGQQVYVTQCVVCHGENGEGVKSADGRTYTYPPLWGEHSYNSGAGLYRISRFAGYVKANMPLGATIDFPILTDEQAWDVAAYVNSQIRPEKDLSADWPDISKKPIDHPFGPYSDGFTEIQHKYGSFKPIVEARKK